MRWMYDASTPPLTPPKWHVAAGYIGGDTPHVWTPAEWARQPAAELLPIWTASNRADTGDAAVDDAADIVRALEDLGVPRGCSVCVDTETTLYTHYLEVLDFELTQARYPLINYGSYSFVIRNPVTAGGRWAASWTDNIMAGVDLAGRDRIVAVQWADDVMLHIGYDASVIEDQVPLWRRP